LLPETYLTRIRKFTLKGKDEKGGTAMVTIADVFQSNGVIQVMDTVLMPN
jgi:uncharacterized surface protein with fasciclin (FAS1) repeats